MAVQSVKAFAKSRSSECNQMKENSEAEAGPQKNSEKSKNQRVEKFNK